MTRIFFTVLTFFLPGILAAQDIKQLFKALPASYIDREFGEAVKDSLLHKKFFRPPITDSSDIVVFELTALDTQMNYLRISYYWESGQAAFVTTELRSFKTKEGKTILLLSKVGGMHHLYWQNDLSVFHYTKDKGLTKVKAALYGLPIEGREKDFIKPGTTEKTIKDIEDNYDARYELGPGTHIQLVFSTPTMLDEPNQWLLGDTIKFIWNGTRFVKQMPAFSEE